MIAGTFGFQPAELFGTGTTADNAVSTEYTKL
jgi:hypothetical protein